MWDRIKIPVGSASEGDAQSWESEAEVAVQTLGSWRGQECRMSAEESSWAVSRGSQDRGHWGGALQTLRSTPPTTMRPECPTWSCRI